ncbi:MAG TPA: glycosyltransferase family 4 protein, partial [Candidatus Polarisedimenticolia bacterium]|nr:glycosyltransferase family 4 protein [Candidatus Polarisedimenticolia bacterium]
RADAIQIVNTCAGIVKAGAGVALCVETIRSASSQECLAFYGVTAPGLSLTALGKHWSWPLFTLSLRRVMKRPTTTTCLFVREVRPYVPGLIRRARALGMTVLFEAHNVSAALVNEKQRRTGAGPELGRKAAARATLEAAILESIDGLVCTQRATLDGLKDLIRPGLSTIVLGNGTQLPPAAPGSPKEIDVLYCGSLKPWKGVDTLIAALRQLPGRTLTLVGPATPSDAERVRDLAREAGALDRIAILPPVKPVEVWALYARARVGVIPLPGRDYVEAREFTSPLKLFEMMAAGLPVVASRLPSLAEYVTDGREAVLVPPDDPAALASGISRVANDPGLAARLSGAARTRASAFTWDARGRDLLAFAERVARPA